MDDWASLSVFGFGAMRLANRGPDHGINENDHQIPTPYDGEGGAHIFTKNGRHLRTSRFHTHPALYIIGRVIMEIHPIKIFVRLVVESQSIWRVDYRLVKSDPWGWLQGQQLGFRFDGLGGGRPAPCQADDASDVQRVVW